MIELKIFLQAFFENDNKTYQYSQFCALSIKFGETVKSIINF